MFKRMLSCFFSLHLMFSFAYADDSHDGWWYDPDHPGSGLSLAIRGDTMFLAMFTFVHNDGFPIWFTSGAKDQGDGVYAGKLLYWLNDIPDLFPNNPESHSVGDIAVGFTSDQELLVAYKVPELMGQDEELLKVKMVPFMANISGGSSDDRVKGWWYDPDEIGMGFFMEARGGTLFGAWYYYYPEQTLGLPIWNTFSGKFTRDMTTFSAALYDWKDGSMLGTEPYVAPASRFFGFDIYLKIKEDGTIDYGWAVPGQIPEEWFHLERFTF